MITLTDRKAKLLTEGCEVKAELKRGEIRLKEIREELDLTKVGVYTNKEGSSLTIGKTEKFTEISPKKVLDYLKKQNMAGKFPETVKVQLTQLKKFVPISVFDRWRKPLDPVFRWTWG